MKLSSSSVLCLFSLLLSFSSLRAQRNYTSNFNNANELMTDVTGKPIYLKVTYNIEGSPFFPADYSSATIYGSTGKIFQGIRVKFNMMDDLLLMMTDEGQELVTVTPVYKVIYDNKTLQGVGEYNIFERGFPAINQQTDKTWYQVLDTGKVQLLKLRTVSYSDKQAYGSASISRVFEQAESWYLFFSNENRMAKLEKGKEDLLSVFKDKKEELSRYIDNNDLKCKKESDWKKIIAYYNSVSVN